MEGRQFSRLLAAEMCASAVIMLDTPCSEVVWRVLATHSIRQFRLHFPFCASPRAITFQLDSTTPNTLLCSDFSSQIWHFLCLILFLLDIVTAHIAANSLSYNKYCNSLTHHMHSTPFRIPRAIKSRIKYKPNEYPNPVALQPYRALADRAAAAGQRS